MNMIIKKILAVLAWPFKQLWSLVSDRQWHFDPYKLMGFICYSAGIWLSFKVFQMAGIVPDASLAILSAVVTGLFTGGTVMFNQGRKSDDTLPPQ